MENKNVLKKGDFVIYTKTMKIVQISDVHHDDYPPYYTIKISPKKTKQTIRKYVVKLLTE